MSTNPFDSCFDDGGVFYVLTNDEKQHILWSAFVDVPAGWRVVFGGDTRANCRAYVKNNCADMRPNSLREAMAGNRAG